eukprot:TRINITY_DN34309_c0_g1_i1.p1 TRINITY_DN34309_c0_g1~~TRINITY_DN34309_c0_g1_i1.p1  ORF type:complete len:994 (-),score=200.99 TRINITY_DN34309_c0_g1_i1:147-3128(-)
MGCFACGRVSTASASKSFDVLITQTHSVHDTGASNLTRWLRDICDRGGVDAFCEEGLSSSTNITGKRRRRLRDTFEAVHCVVAAVVGDVLKHSTESRPPLTNEVQWAEQHQKPVVLLYDAGKSFSREAWEAECPFLFRPFDVLVRYYGKGHDESAKEVLQALHGVIGDDRGCDVSDTAVVSASVAAIRAVACSKKDEEDERVEDEEREERFAALRGRQVLPQDEPAERAAAFEVLRAAQEAAGPTLELPSTKAGILHKRPGETEEDTRARRRPLGSLAPPPEPRLQEAIRLLAAKLTEGDDYANTLVDVAETSQANADSPVAPSDTALECLRVGIGVSELLVAKALRVLVWQLQSNDGDGLPAKDRALESAEWAIAALRRHSDSPDVCTCALELLAFAQPALPSRCFSSADVGLFVTVLRDYPQSAALQRHGFGLVANILADEMNSKHDSKEQVTEEGDKDPSIPVFALRGGGLARIFTRSGTAELALIAVGRHHGDVGLVVEACAVLQGLSAASREVKLLLVSSKAARLWVALLTQTKPGAAVAIAALRMLASLVTDDPEVKGAAGVADGLFQALKQRLDCAVIENAAGEVCEILGLLCRLTARHGENKNRCISSGGIVRVAVEKCLADEADSYATRLAAGGLLVNLCSVADGRQLALEAHASEAAEALLRASGDLQRCGLALQRLLAREPCPLPTPAPSHSADEGKSAFEGLFAVRRSAPSKVARACFVESTDFAAGQNDRSSDQAERRNTVSGDAGGPRRGERSLRKGSGQRNPKISRRESEPPLPSKGSVSGNVSSGESGGGGEDIAVGIVALQDEVRFHDIDWGRLDGPTSWEVTAECHTNIVTTLALTSGEQDDIGGDDGLSDAEEVESDRLQSTRGSLLGFEDDWDLPSDAGTVYTVATSATARGLKGNQQMRGRLDELRAAEAKAAAAASSRRLFSFRGTSSAPKHTSVADEVIARRGRQGGDAYLASLVVSASASDATSVVSSA